MHLPTRLVFSFAMTEDFETLVHGTVTVRERDSTVQIRLANLLRSTTVFQLREFLSLFWKTMMLSFAHPRSARPRPFDVFVYELLGELLMMSVIL
jgi:hypothetical protein